MSRALLKPSKHLMNCKNLAKIALSVLLASSGALVTPVYAENETANTTQINYEVSEAYEWMAPVDFSFTQNSNGSEAHTATVKVTKNVIGANKTLKISIANGQEFALTDSANSANKRTYTVKDGATSLSSGSEVLAVPSGTNTGSKDMQVQMDSEAVEVAGTYAGTLKFTSSLSSSYRIEYHLDGGDNDPGNPTSFTSESEDITLASPTKFGYVFSGWYTEPEFTNPITTIANGTAKNVDLYAKWIIAAATFYDSDLGTDVGLTWEELKMEENGTKYSYDASAITDTSIGDGAFWNCDSLRRITIPESVTSIGTDAFYSCTSLTYVDIQDGVEIIGYEAFVYCSSLAYITIPDSITHIDGAAFDGCTNLTSFDIPSNVSFIGGAAFRDCASLYSISIPEGITWIDRKTFLGCTSLTSVTIPNSVTTIDQEAFMECTSLASVTIPHGVTSIESTAFKECTDLTSVTISDSVTNIGSNAFDNCTSLTLITFEGTQEEWNSISKGSDWDISTGNYTVHCTDGEIVKESTSTTSTFSARTNSFFAPVTNLFAKIFA